MGGAERVQRQKDAGRLTVRERIDALLDAGSFEEWGGLAGFSKYGPDGALEEFTPANNVFGTGRIEGRKVVVSGDDFSVRGGAADASIHGKQVYAERMANELRLPIVRLVDGTGGGGSVKMLETMGRTYVPANPAWDLVVDNYGKVPVAAACLGPVAGLGAARVAHAHFSVMVKGVSQLFVAGPPVVKAGMGQEVTKEELGGWEIHARESGAVDNVVDTEREALEQIRRFLSYLPSSAWEAPPRCEAVDDPRRRDEWLLSAVPRNRRQAYDMRRILAAVFDTGSVFELGRLYGASLITALARLDGYAVAVVDAERSGTIRRGVRALAAVYQARSPFVSVILRRVFGVAGAGHGNAQRLNLRFAWPSGDWGSLPVEGGLEAAYRRELEASADPAALKAEIAARLEAVRSPFRTAESFGVEKLIDPRETRPLLTEWVADAYRLVVTQLGPSARPARP